MVFFKKIREWFLKTSYKSQKYAEEKQELEKDITIVQVVMKKYIPDKKVLSRESAEYYKKRIEVLRNEDLHIVARYIATSSYIKSGAGNVSFEETPPGAYLKRLEELSKKYDERKLKSIKNFKRVAANAVASDLGRLPMKLANILDKLKSA